MKKPKSEKDINKKRYSPKIGKIFIFLSSVLLLFFVKVGKTKAIAPLAAWLIAIGGSYVGGEAINYLGLNPLNPHGGFGSTFTGNGLGTVVLWVFNLLLLAVYGVFSVFVFMAGMLMDWAINPNNFLIVVNSPAIHEGWKIVRDFLNIAFILVLLYSAFCTIFQVEKYHLKKILLMVVLMALLVNFSFPVARFIIDSANVLMYFILNTAFQGQMSNDSGISGSITAMARIVDMSMPTGNSSEPWVYTVELLLAIIFLFIFAITLLVIGVLLLVRIVVLAIIIIFAPIGFVGAIFPSTSKYADDWWSQLFKQSFFGPIMAFMLYLAIFMMGTIKNGLEVSIQNMVKNNTTIAANYSSFIVNGIYMFIPTVILWTGLIAAQKMGAAGADAVVGKAKSIAGKAGMWAMKAPFKAAWWGTKKAAMATGVPGGLKQKWDNIASKFKLAQEKREAKIAEKGPFKVAGAGIKNAESRAAEYDKNHESDASLIIKAEAGDAGAALALVKRGKMNDKIYGNFIKNNKDASVREHVVKKLKKNRVDILVAHKLSDAKEIQKAKEEISRKTGTSVGSISDDMAKKHIEKEEYGNLSPEDIKTQHWNIIIDKATPQTKKYIKDMFLGLTMDAKNDIGKAMSKNNRTSIDTLRSGGIF